MTSLPNYKCAVLYVAKNLPGQGLGKHFFSWIDECVLKDSGIFWAGVIGLGGIGLSALMAINEYQPKNLIAIDVSDEKLHMAKLFVANHVINSKTQNVNEEINKICPDGVDACVESAGKIETIELGFSLIKNSGRLYFASHPEQGRFIKIDPFELISGKQIFGSWGGACNPDIDIPRLAESYKNGSFPLEKLITKSFERLLDKGKIRGFITYEELGKSLGKRGSSVENVEKTFMIILDHSVTLVERKSQYQSNKKKDALVAFLKTLTGIEVYTNEIWSDPFDITGNITIVGSQLSSNNEVFGKAITIYPNPVDTQLTILLESGNYQVSIYNTRGQLVHEQSIAGNDQINLQSLVKAIYILKIKDVESNKKFHQKFIKK